MTQPTPCRTCGRPLPAGRTSEDPCPSCLLALAAEPEVFHTRGPAPAQPPPLDEVRRLFPQLELEAAIGIGGMGVVYRARQTRLDRTVALKILDRGLAAEPGFAERFEREARAMARLSHPSIVHVYDFGEVEGVFWLLMEFVEGVNLRQRLQSEPLEPEQALWLVPQICDALQYAHELGVVHRDIKPENILLDVRGNVKLADFGLAKLLKDGQHDQSLTRASQVMGTPQYMAPEQRSQPLEVDHRADIYSLGVVLYEMLTGELPVGRFRLPSERQGVDARLDEVVLKAMEREPNLRYQKVSEVGTDVQGLRKPPVSEPSVASPPPTKARPEPGPEEPALLWMENIPGGALTCGFTSVALGFAWLLLVLGQRHYNDMGDSLVISYCLAFLGWVAAGRLALGSTPRAASVSLRVLAGLVCFLSVTLLARSNYSRGGAVPMEMLASIVLLGAHVLLDRWIRSGRGVLALAALAPLIVAGLLHASVGRSPGRESYYYITGMLALLSVSSVLARLPEFFTPHYDARHGGVLLRGVPVAACCALLYFHDYLLPSVLVS